MSTSVGLLCLSHGILTHVGLDWRGLVWLFIVMEVCWLVNGPIDGGVGWVWLCVVIMGWWVVMGPKGLGVCWVRTLGFESGLGPIAGSEALKSLTLSSMLAFMLRFSTDASSVPEMQPLWSLRDRFS